MLSQLASASQKSLSQLLQVTPAASTVLLTRITFGGTQPQTPLRYWASPGVAELVARPDPDGVERSTTWWALRWELAGASEGGQVVVLDAARLWDHHRQRLHPTDPVTVWTRLAPLLDAVARAASAAEQVAGRDVSDAVAAAPSAPPDTPA